MPALGEDAGQRQIGVVARMTRAGDDRRRIGGVEAEQDDGVGERLQAPDRVRAEPVGVELDGGDHAVPVVVERLLAAAADGADGTEFDGRRHDAPGGVHSRTTVSYSARVRSLGGSLAVPI